jgi:hypothetical protein
MLSDLNGSPRITSDFPGIPTEQRFIQLKQYNTFSSDQIIELQYRFEAKLASKRFTKYGRALRAAEH